MDGGLVGVLLLQKKPKTACVSTPTQSNPTKTTKKRPATKNTFSPCTSIPILFGCFSTEEGHQPWRLGGERSRGQRIWGAMWGRWDGEDLIDFCCGSWYFVVIPFLGESIQPYSTWHSKFFAGPGGLWISPMKEIRILGRKAMKNSQEICRTWSLYLHLGSLVRTWFCSHLWSVIRHLRTQATLFLYSTI